MSAGTKQDSGKVRYDLIPAGPLHELARVYTIGAEKYEPRGWEKGLAWGRIFAAMMRHAWAYWRGERFDPVDGQHHMASVAWGAFALMEFETTHPELDDRPGITGIYDDTVTPQPGGIPLRLVSNGERADDGDGQRSVSPVFPCAGCPCPSYCAGRGNRCGAHEEIA